MPPTIRFSGCELDPLTEDSVWGSGPDDQVLPDVTPCCQGGPNASCQFHSGVGHPPGLES